MSAEALVPDSKPAFDTKITWVVYDGDCPFCTQFVKLMRLRAAIGPVKPLNAREPHPVVEFVRSKGVDLNQEMALVMHGEVYAGAECVHRLSLMSTGSGLFNGLMSKVFASPRLTRALYPVMRTGRNITLALMGRRAIAQPAE
jgi:predicted DCC family thiol-disulfide oxidoreductase YuxK